MSTLYLLPNLISDDTWNLLPRSLETLVPKLDALICEHEKEGRKYLKEFALEKMRTLPLYILNEHTSDIEYKELIDELQGNIGLISDAGLPILADPGAKLVSKFREKRGNVRAFMGPSSIILALLLSGFSAQSFSFHGYLPRKEPDLIRELKRLETLSKKQTQIWIEAPYRSDKMKELSLKILSNRTKFAVAKNVTAPNETVYVYTIQRWKNLSIHLGKEPCVFLLSSNFS